MILVTAAIVTLIFKRLRQPVVLGYIVAGFLVSPHMPLTASVVDVTDIQTWADIGVMFLLFALGLDFSFKKIIKMGAAPVVSTLVIVCSMIILGFTAGKAFGWRRMDCVFLGGMLAMSSTTIIYKALDDMGLRQQKFASMVMSVLIMEDVLAIVLMVVLAALAGGSADGGTMLMSIVKIGFFLILWFVVGLFVIPSFLRKTRCLLNGETLLIVALGLCCLMAVLSTKAGFSSAFGAFVMGSILAETVEADKIIRLVSPVKDLFGAIFFVSVGMLVDPAVIAKYAIPIFVLVLTILVGQAVLGSTGFLLGGQPLRSAMRCGFAMAQIGEFSFIIASMGQSMGVTSTFLYPIVVAVSVITTFLTPYMIRFAEPCYRVLERHLSPALIKSLNRTAVEAAPQKQTSRWHQLLFAMLRTTVIYSVLSIATITLMFALVLPMLRKMFPDAQMITGIATGLVTIIFISPFLRAIVMKKNHSDEFRTLWSESRHNRLPLLVTVLVRVIIAVAFVFYVSNKVTPFGHSLLISIAVAAVTMMVLSRRLQRSSIELERTFLRNLRSRDIEAQVMGRQRPAYEKGLLDRDVHIADVTLPDDSAWGGSSLGDLNLGKNYGVHISSILRGHRRMNIPCASTILFPGDRLEIIGSDTQLAAFNAAASKAVVPDDPNVESREIKLRSVQFPATHELVGKTLREGHLRTKYHCMVVGIEEGKEQLTQPTADYTIHSGDVLWVVGEESDLERLIHE